MAVCVDGFCRKGCQCHIILVAYLGKRVRIVIESICIFCTAILNEVGPEHEVVCLGDEAGSDGYVRSGKVVRDYYGLTVYPYWILILRIHFENISQIVFRVIYIDCSSVVGESSNRICVGGYAAGDSGSDGKFHFSGQCHGVNRFSLAGYHRDGGDGQDYC